MVEGLRFMVSGLGQALHKKAPQIVKSVRSLNLKPQL